MAKTIIYNVRLFDGKQVHSHQTVTIEGKTISSIEPSSSTAPSAESGTTVIDGTSHTLLPGLIDAHVHTAFDRLQEALKFGITTELEMMGHWPKEDRDRVAESDDMADVRSAGFGLTGPGGHPSELHDRVKKGKGGGPPNGHGKGGPPAGRGGRGGGPPPGSGGGQHKHGHEAPTASTVAEAITFVDDRVAFGSDYIKIMIEEGSVLGSPNLPVLPSEVLSTAVKHAQNTYSKIVVAHALTLEAATLALSVGVNGLAHLFIDQVATPEIISMMTSAGSFVTPCLSLNASIMDTGRSVAFAKDPRVSSRLPQHWIDTLTASFNTFPTGSFESNLLSVKLLHDAGVDLLTGTDVSVPMAEFGGLAHGASVHHELQLFVEAGLTPIEALKAATSVPARRFGLTDRGTVEAGKRADLVLVHGDPTTEISDTLNLVGIWRRGKKLESA